MKTDDKEFITLTEASELYPLAYATLAQAAREGRLDVLKLGGGPKEKVGFYLTTHEAVERAIADGKLRPREQKDEEDK